MMTAKVPNGRVELFLVDDTNEFQRLLQQDAEAAAASAGLVLETAFSGVDFARQLSLVQRSLDGDHRPDAILLMCVNDRGLQRVAQRAARKGVHVIFLNRSEDDLDAVRAESPHVAVSIVGPDERETGRIQGRQFRRIVPPGGRALYVQGRTRSLTARDRTAGLLESLAGAPFAVVPIEAGWTLEDGREAVATWLRLTLRVHRKLELIGCQNDALALGALEALDTVATELGRPEIRTIPVTGCDGSPEQGQSLVRKGALRATVVLPRATGPALQIVDCVLRTGTLPPPIVLLSPVSFPTETELSVRTEARPGVARAPQAGAAA
jgi:ABC-type sugar transport system substrate-binding protein